jgi:hypothetical protein
MEMDANIKVDTYLAGQKIPCYGTCKFITTTTKACSYLKKKLIKQSDNWDPHFWPGFNTSQITKQK